MSSTSNDIASWFVLQGWRTLLAVCIFLVALVFAYSSIFPLNPDYPTPKIVGIIAAIFALGSFRTILQGGCTLDFQSRVLTRWWGPFLPMRVVRLSFHEIQAVVIKGGAISKIDGGTWFHVLIQTKSDDLLVKSDRRREASLRFANTLADEVEVPLTNLTEVQAAV